MTGRVGAAVGSAPASAAATPRSDLSTTWKPRVSVHSSSSTEMSNERLVTASQTPGGSWSMTSSIATKKLTTWRCSSITPLGVPVEPDV